MIKQANKKRILICFSALLLVLIAVLAYLLKIADSFNNSYSNLLYSYHSQLVILFCSCVGLEVALIILYLVFFISRRRSISYRLYGLALISLIPWFVYWPIMNLVISEGGYLVTISQYNSYFIIIFSIFDALILGLTLKVAKKKNVKLRQFTPKLFLIPAVTYMIYTYYSHSTNIGCVGTPVSFSGVSNGLCAPGQTANEMNVYNHFYRALIVLVMITIINAIVIISPIVRAKLKNN